MYLAAVHTILVEALRATFDAEHSNPDMRNLPVKIEYPLDEASYPGMWVNFVSTGDTHNVGIGHVEYSEEGGGFKEVYRWTFSGVAEMTVAALSNLERSRMIDALTSTIAFGRADLNAEGDFRKVLEYNDLVGLRVLWESFTISGFAENPGTPWQTDDIIYEASVSLTIEGEVAHDPATGLLVPLSDIRIIERREDEEDTTDSGLGAWH